MYLTTSGFKVKRWCNMGETSAFLTGRNAFIGAVIALAFNPISLVIGYYLSKVLRNYLKTRSKAESHS